MGSFTFVPVWIVQDVLILAAAVGVLVYIMKKEEHPTQILLEMICFCLLYAAVYENFATLMKWYGYGRSVIMVFNVPLTVPIVEYLVVYSTLRMLQATRMPTWVKPFVVGASGMLFDFSMDPVATMQVFAGQEGPIGRWSWFIGPNDVHIFTDPVYNYTGWILLCGFAAVFLLLGRFWHRKSGHSSVVGYLYPVLAMLAALGVLVSPLSSFLLWLGPFFSKGSATEWVMLAALTALTVILVVVTWRGRSDTRLTLRDEIPLVLVLVGLPVTEVVFTIIGRYWNVLPLEAGAAALGAGLVFGLFAWSPKKPTAS